MYTRAEVASRSSAQGAGQVVETGAQVSDRPPDHVERLAEPPAFVSMVVGPYAVGQLCRVRCRSYVWRVWAARGSVWVSDGQA